MVLRFGLALGLRGLTYLFRNKQNLERELRRPFECGFSSLTESRLPFSLRFFIVALIFLIFDVELLILFPYLRRLVFRIRRLLILVFITFLFFLSLGLFYE